jgi:hypothetical protein
MLRKLSNGCLPVGDRHLPHRGQGSQRNVVPRKKWGNTSLAFGNQSLLGLKLFWISTFTAVVIFRMWMEFLHTTLDQLYQTINVYHEMADPTKQTLFRMFLTFLFERKNCLKEFWRKSTATLSVVNTRETASKESLANRMRNEYKCNASVCWEWR